MGTQNKFIYKIFIIGKHDILSLCLYYNFMYIPYSTEIYEISYNLLKYNT